MNKILIAFILFTFLAQPSLGGEISGKIKLNTTDLPGRAVNSNPNRKKSLKKYGMRLLKSARKNQGGLPPNAKVDERDFAVVFITQKMDGSKLKSSRRTVTVDQVNRRFMKHVTPVTLGSQVRFTNQDSFFHHIYCPDSSRMNVPEHAGTVTRKADRLGRYELFCDIHPLMNAYLYVVPNDFYMLAQGGGFKIEDIPPGRYEVRLWHPRLEGSSQEVTVTEDQPQTVNFEL